MDQSNEKTEPKPEVVSLSGTVSLDISSGVKERMVETLVAKIEEAKADLLVLEQKLRRVDPKHPILKY